MGGLELCLVFLFRGVWKVKEKIKRFHRGLTTIKLSQNGPKKLQKFEYTLTCRPSYLGVDGATLFHHGVEAWRHGGVFSVRGARRAGRPGTAVIWRLRHGGWERARY